MQDYMSSMSSEFNRGKVWEYLETSAFIASGAGLANLIFKVDPLSSVAFSALSFLVGKSGYWITNSVASILSDKYKMDSLSLKNIRLCGWTVGTSIAAAVGYAVLRSTVNPPSFIEVASVNLLSIPLSVALREISYAGFKEILNRRKESDDIRNDNDDNSPPLHAGIPPG